MNVRAANIATRFFLGIIVVTALLAVWYYYGRNPGLRAMFPFGNPTFLSAALIPGIVLCVAFMGKIIFDVVVEHRKLPVLLLLLIIMAGGFCVWSFYLARSRGPTVGLLYAVMAMLFFALRGRRSSRRRATRIRHQSCERRRAGTHLLG